MIKSWIFEFFATPPRLIEDFDPAASLRHFDGYLDAWTSAEAAGFEGVFFSEHHFGASYSPSPNLLIAAVAARTKKLRLGVMGMVPPYHSPWRLVEEIGMLDHLTGGRLEIGTSPGIPPEMAQVGLSVEEARARYDEAVEIIDQALAEPVISHHGKFWNFDNMRLTPRTIQQPHPPKWVTVVSASSARKAARRGAKISTGFHPQDKVIEIFDAYRDEAAKAGRKARPDDLCLRRQVVMDEDKEALAKRRVAYRDFLKFDPRLNHPGPSGARHAVVAQFHHRRRRVHRRRARRHRRRDRRPMQRAGAGHFAGLFDRLISPAQTAEVYRVFGEAVIPKLRATPV